MSKELSTEVSKETLTALSESFPVDKFANRISLPRISMKSQDVTKESGSGKNKKIELITPAGTFFLENPTEEEDDYGKKIWEKTDIGSSFKGIILFQRKMLSLYDSQTETYTSSTVYDNDNEIVPLFSEKKEIARGIPSVLKAQYQYKDPETGKIKSKLQDNKILYVKNIADDKVYQLNLKGSSMWSFSKYCQKTIVPANITEFSSEPQEKGKIAWNQMTFNAVRKLTQKEGEEVLGQINEIKETIVAEKAQFGGGAVSTEGDAEMVELVGAAKKSKDF